MICAAVTYVIKPGHEEEAAELFRTLTAAHPRRAGLPDVPGPSFDDRSPPVLALRAICRSGRARCPPSGAAFRAVRQGGPVSDHRDSRARALRAAHGLSRAFQELDNKNLARRRTVRPAAGEAAFDIAAMAGFIRSASPAIRPPRHLPDGRHQEMPGVQAW